MSQWLKKISGKKSQIKENSNCKYKRATKKGQAVTSLHSVNALQDTLCSKNNATNQV